MMRLSWSRCIGRTRLLSIFATLLAKSRFQRVWPFNIQFRECWVRAGRWNTFMRKIGEDIRGWVGVGKSGSAPPLVPETSLPGLWVVRELETVITHRGRPAICVSTRLAFSGLSLPLPGCPHFGAVATYTHLTPAAAIVLGRVEEQPATFLACTPLCAQQVLLH